jgi:hypothetical protein
LIPTAARWTGAPCGEAGAAAAVSGGTPSAHTLVGSATTRAAIAIATAQAANTALIG